MTQLQKNRSRFYTFLARLYEKELSPHLIQQLATLNYPTVAKHPDMTQGYQKMAHYLQTTPHQTCVDDLACDYAKVFLGAGETKGHAAFPYESVYTSPEKLVMQEAWTQVCQIYATAGLQLQSELTDIKEDHLAVELKFMAYLCQENDLTLQTTFLNEHLLPWLTAFLADVKTYSQTEFYQGVAQLTAGFLAYDQEILAALQQPEPTKSFQLTPQAFNTLLQDWQTKYHIYAPKNMPQATHAKHKVRYGEIQELADIVYDRQSDFSAKEIYYPIIQTLFYFNDEGCIPSEIKDDKDFLIFMHPCDINALRRTDTIFMKNGGLSDNYYERLRSKVKIVMMECTESYDNCFCVAMHANEASNYDLAVRLAPDQVQMKVQNTDFLKDFDQYQHSHFEPRFIQTNQQQVHLPEIKDTATLKLAGHLDYWQTFNDRCISCGGCNTVCPTCSCFDTTDVTYDELGQSGERRRIWSACMLPTFSQTAGGNRARQTAGDNMRFKTLHKVYDYKKRFGVENMCVGCGRCTQHCPKDISFSETINGFQLALQQAQQEMRVN